MSTSGVINLEGRGTIVHLQQPEIEQSIEELVQDIRNINLTAIGLINEMFLAGLTPKELTNVLEALMACPTMDTLRMLDLRDRSFQALQKALLVDVTAPRRLSTLWCVGLTLLEDKSKDMIVPFVESLSNIPTLEKLNFLLIAPAPDEGSGVSSSITAEFRCSGFGAERVLWSFGLYDDTISLIRDVIRFNQGRFSNIKVSGTDASGAATQTLGVLLLTESTASALDKMQLDFDLTHENASQHIGNALSRNHSLKELSLQIDEGHSDSFRIDPLADMLRTNTTLEWFELSRSLLTDTTAKALSTALRDNQTLKVLDVNFNIPGNVRMTAEGFQALLDLLQFNHVLEIVPMHGLDNENLRRRIEWYLNLNDSGLRTIQLSVNTSQDEFLGILSNQEDMDYVFYLLSQNAMLFSMRS